MSLISLEFLLFILFTSLVYYKISLRFRWVWLLASSYFYYLTYDPRYTIFLAVSTLTTYGSGLLISCRRTSHYKKLWVAMSFLVNVGILLALKYLNFISSLAAKIVPIFGGGIPVHHFDLLLPIGISFYMFQSLSYTIDVYRGDVKPERNLGKYALFVSFFPTLLSGPIQKAKDTLARFDEVHNFDYEGFRRGCLLILFGYFQKMVVADQLSVPVDTDFADPSKFHGLDSMIAVLFYSLQIYFDFAGYSNIAIGIAELFGFHFSSNFDRPYFSGSIREFWRRWHISLSTWFRDYLYFPLGGGRCSMFRQCLNVMIVFAVCGLWHGASLTFLVWGTLHGVFQIVGRLTQHPRRNLRQRLQNRIGFAPVHVLSVVFTFLLVTFAWIFFRADTLKNSFIMISNMFRFDTASFRNGSIFQLGLSVPQFIAALVGVLLACLADFLQGKTDVRSLVLKKGTAFRWSFYVAAVMILLIFGKYGPVESAQQFIYSKF